MSNSRFNNKRFSESEHNLICFLYTYDGINYESQHKNPNEKFRLKVDRTTNQYLFFNHNDDNNKDKCLSYWSKSDNKWFDHPPVQKKYKKKPCDFPRWGVIDNNYPIDNQPFRIEYYSIHRKGSIDLHLYDERFRIHNNNNEENIVHGDASI